VFCVGGTVVTVLDATSGYVAGSVLLLSSLLFSASKFFVAMVVFDFVESSSQGMEQTGL
jgi:hypothetical protein